MGPPRGPLTDGKNTGASQEMAFVRATASSFLATMRDGAGTRQALPTEASLGTTCPTPQIPCQDHMVPGTGSRELDAFPPTQSTPRVPEDHTSEQVSHHCTCRVPREAPGNWDRDWAPATVPRQLEWAWEGGTHAQGRVLPWGLRPASGSGG